MKQIKELISELKLYQPRILSARKCDSELTSVALYNANINFRNDTIYVGYLSQIRQILRFQTELTLFAIQETDTTVPTDFHKNCLVIFPSSTDPLDLIHICIEYFKTRNQLFKYSHMIMQVYLEDGSLHKIIETGAEIIGNPIMVIDNSYQVLCEAGSEGCHDILWMESLETGTCSYDFITQFNQLHEIENIEVSTDAFTAGCLTSPFRRGICKLSIDGHIVGYLLSVELNCTFDHLKLQLLKLIAQLVSRMMVTAQLERNRNPFSSFSSIFAEALHGTITDQDLFHNSLKNANILLESNYYLILIDISNYSSGHNENLIEIIREKISFVYSNCYETRLILLVESDWALDKMHRHILSHSDYFNAQHLIVCISDHFHTLDQLHIYYKQLCFVQKLNSSVHNVQTVCTYDDFRIYNALIDQLTKKNHLMFIDAKAQEINNYDKEHHTEYLRTLHWYFHHNRSIKETASYLYTHKNTITYRIQRARELFHLDLNDANLTLKLLMGYKIYRMYETGMIKEPNED